MKDFPGTNALAYFGAASVTKNKSLMTSAADARIGLPAHATPLRFGTTPALPAPEPLYDAALLPAVAAPGFGFDRILSAVVDGDAFLHLLLHGGHESAVFGRQGLEEAVVEVSYEVHDVVSKTRRA